MVRTAGISPKLGSLLLLNCYQATQVSQQGALFPSLRLRLGGVAARPIGAIPLTHWSPTLAAMQAAYRLAAHRGPPTGQFGPSTPSPAPRRCAGERQGSLPVRPIGRWPNFDLSPGCRSGQTVQCRWAGFAFWLTFKPKCDRSMAVTWEDNDAYDS